MRKLNWKELESSKDESAWPTTDFGAEHAFPSSASGDSVPEAASRDEAQTEGSPNRRFPCLGCKEYKRGPGWTKRACHPANEARCDRSCCRQVATQRCTTDTGRNAGSRGNEKCGSSVRSSRFLAQGRTKYGTTNLRDHCSKRDSILRNFLPQPLHRLISTAVGQRKHTTSLREHPGTLRQAFRP